MTKTFDLEYHDGWYGLPRPVGEDGKYITPKPVLCERFVAAIFGSPTEKPLTAIISDQPIANATEIAVLKSGYYRWSWRFANGDDVEHRGMRWEAENILCSFFSDERSDGLNKELKAWIRLTA